MAETKKDTLYIDVEDDITAIIDKVKSSKSRIIAAVLPKRAQMLHSSVNMRLLKRAADSDKKRVVLITTEKTVLSLAGSVGMYAAKSLTSKPAIPQAEHEATREETVTIDTDSEPEVDASKSIGELAGAAAVAGMATRPGEEETIELEDEPTDQAAGTPATDKSKKEKKNRKLKVPNFDKFRTRLFVGIGVGILLLVLGFFMFFVWPKADIVITTETRKVESKFTFVANTSATEFNREQKILPAVSKEVKQTATETFVPTGSKDIGNKAKGFVSLANCNPNGDVVTLPEGTRLIVGDAAFLTDSNITVPVSNGQIGTGICKKDKTVDVDVTAELGGDKFNLSARPGYTAPGYPDISGYGSNMTGGTTNVVRVVSAEDVENAKQKMLLRNTDEAKNQLQQQLKGANLYPLTDTFTSAYTEPTSNPAVGQQADSVTVTMDFVYAMLGVSQADLKLLVDDSLASSVDGTKERIYEDGMNTAKVTVAEKKSPGDFSMNYNGTATVGPILDAQAIAQEVAGKPGGEAKTMIESRPGISSAEIYLNPFYVFRVPKKVGNIHITFNVDGAIVQ